MLANALILKKQQETILPIHPSMSGLGALTAAEQQALTAAQASVRSGIYAQWMAAAGSGVGSYLGWRINKTYFSAIIGMTVGSLTGMFAGKMIASATK